MSRFIYEIEVDGECILKTAEREQALEELELTAMLTDAGEIAFRIIKGGATILEISGGDIQDFLDDI